MSQSRDRSISAQGIILRRTVWHESSYILDVLTPTQGRISVMAQGVRRPKKGMEGMFEPLNQCEWQLHNKPESNWFIMRDVSLHAAHLYQADVTHSALMQAAAELLMLMLYDEAEAAQLYKLLTEYLHYVETTERNGIAVFWRFLLRIALIFGVPFFLNRCARCEETRNDFVAYYPQRNGLICCNCMHPVLKDVVIPLSDETCQLFRLLPSIGNHLSEISISRQSARSITDILLLHLSEHFHRSIKLKSLELYFLV